MSITQSVKLYHGKGFEGQGADLQTANDISAVNKGTTILAAGAPVVFDGEGAVKVVGTASTAAQFVGVVLRELDDVTNQGSVVGINPKRTGTVRTMGTIWVKAGEAITAGDPCYVGTGSDVVGTFRKSAGSAGTLAVAVDGKYLTDAAAGELVLLSLKNI